MMASGTIIPHSPPKPSFRDYLKTRSAVDIHPGWRGKVNLPDGSIIKIDRHGNYEVVDDQAVVRYKACRFREFNRYLNASDLLEEFIRDAGKLGVKQHQVVSGLFGAFLHWLIIRAAEADGDPIPEEILPLEQQPNLLPAPPTIPRCRRCGRFIEHARSLPFCSEAHLLVYWRKEQLCLPRR